MKFGICTNLSKAALLAPGTIDYVEIGVAGAIYPMTEEDLKKTLELSKSIKVPLEAANGFFPREIRLDGPDFEPEKVREYCKVVLEKAARLGIHTVVLGSGGARKMPDGADPAECLKQFEESLVISGDVAAQYGTTIVIEPLNRDETNLINSVAEGAVSARRVNHPNVKLLADLYHVAKENEPMANIVNNADILRHVHIARLQDRTAPEAGDGFDYAPFRDALKAAGYDLRISIEGKIGGDFAETATKSLNFLRSFFG